MADERSSPSAGWREVCDEMGVDRAWEGDPPDCDDSSTPDRGPADRRPEPAIREVGAEAD